MLAVVALVILLTAHVCAVDTSAIFGTSPHQFTASDGQCIPFYFANATAVSFPCASRSLCDADSSPCVLTFQFATAWAGPHVMFNSCQPHAPSSIVTLLYNVTAQLASFSVNGTVYTPDCAVAQKSKFDYTLWIAVLIPVALALAIAAAGIHHYRMRVAPTTFGSAVSPAPLAAYEVAAERGE